MRWSFRIWFLLCIVEFQLLSEVSSEELSLACLQVFIFSRSEVAPGIYECWGNFAESWGLKAYVTWMTMAVFIVPVLIITVCQVKKTYKDRTEFPHFLLLLRTQNTNL